MNRQSKPRVLGVLITLMVTLLASNAMPAQSQSPSTLKIESDDTQVLREGQWISQPTSAASDGGYLYNIPSAAESTQVAVLQLSFTGPTLAVIYVSGPTLGTLALEVDGTVLRTVITTADKTSYGQSTKIDYLTDESHILRVYAQAGDVVGVDAFVITAPSLLPQANSVVQAVRVPCDGNSLIERVSGPYGHEPSIFDLVGADVSVNGRYVAFHSGASGLVAGDTNGVRDIFVMDRQTCQIQRVSVSSSGEQANADSANVRISSSGRFVAFESRASNLVANDGNGWSDLFLHDLQTGVTSLLNLSTNGLQSNNLSQLGGFSADERYFAFMSYASTMVSGDHNQTNDVFVRDLQQNVTELVSHGYDGAMANGGSRHPSLSGDGRFVAFTSSASNLVQNQVGFVYDGYFIYDRVLGKMRQIVGLNGSAPGSPNGYPYISTDGRYIALETFGTGVLAGDQNLRSEILLYDTTLHQLRLITRALNQSYANGMSERPHISPNGRYIVYLSTATDLALNVNTEIVFWEVYVFDQWTGVTTHVSVTPTNDLAYGDSVPLAVLDTGEVLFVSESNTLIASDTNHVVDLFLRQPIAIDTIGLIRPFSAGQPVSYVQTSWVDTLQNQPAPSHYQSITYTPPPFGNTQWITGDWDGDGQKTLGYLSGGVFTYTNSRVANGPWMQVWVGLDTYPVAGRFSAGVNHDCVGVIQSAQFLSYGTGYSLYFTCNLTPATAPPLSYEWLGILLPDAAGFSGVVEFAAGDFDADGIETIAIRRGFFIAWTNTRPTTTPALFPFAQYFGVSGAATNGQFVVGDWNRDNTATFGLFFSDGTFYWRQDLDWNSGVLYVQHIGQPLGSSVTAFSWR